MPSKRKNPPKRSMDDTTVTIQLPKKLKAKFTRLAKKEDRSLSAWMRYHLAEQADKFEPEQGSNSPQPQQ